MRFEIENILLLSQYLRMRGRNHDTRFAKICEIENKRKKTKIKWSRICSTFTFVATTGSHMLAIVSLLNIRCRSRRDYFALIPWLNIQSLHHDGLAQAVISQADKSKWYLCPCAISHRDNIFTSFVFHFAPLGNGTYFEARRLADNSRRKRWTVHFFEEKFYFRYFYAVLETAFHCASQCTSFILFEICCSILFPATARSIISRQMTLLFRGIFILYLLYNIRFIFYLFLN